MINMREIRESGLRLLLLTEAIETSVGEDGCVLARAGDLPSKPSKPAVGIDPLRQQWEQC